MALLKRVSQPCLYQTRAWTVTPSYATLNRTRYLKSLGIEKRRKVFIEYREKQ